MNGEHRPSYTNPGGSSFIRALSILLMLTGLVGFVAARVIYGEQVLLQFGATLVTFIGLGLFFYLKRTGPVQNASHSSQAYQASLNQSEKVNQGWETVTPESNDEPGVYALVDAAADAFQQHGAKVFTETRRAERCILNVQMPNNDQFTVIVNDSKDPVDVSEIRALSALVANNGSHAGYYITAGFFTPRAVTYSSNRPINLIDQGKVDEI